MNNLFQCLCWVFFLSFDNRTLFVRFNLVSGLTHHSVTAQLTRSSLNVSTHVIFFFLFLRQVLGVAMATQVGVSSGEGGQTAPGAIKPSVAPKPHLMPKPFSLKKTPIRQILAPKPMDNKPVLQTTASAKPMLTTTPKPTPNDQAKPDLSSSSQPALTGSTQAISPKPAPAVAPKPATRDPDVASHATPDITASKPEPTSLLKAPPAVAPKPTPVIPTKSDQTDVVKPDLPKGSDVVGVESQGSLVSTANTLPSTHTEKDCLSRTAEQNLPKTSDGGVHLRTRTKSIGAFDRRQQEEALEEGQGPDKAGSDTSQTTETSDAKNTGKWPIRKRLSMDLTSRFESVPLSIPPSVPLRPSKDNNQEQSGKKEPILPPGGLKDRGSDVDQTAPESEPNQKPRPSVVPRREWKRSEEKENERENEKEKDESSGGSIKRRISMLLDSSAASQQRESLKKEEPQLASPAEIAVDVKQRIKELKLDAGMSQNTSRG